MLSITNEDVCASRERDFIRQWRSLASSPSRWVGGAKEVYPHFLPPFMGCQVR